MNRELKRTGMVLAAFLFLACECGVAQQAATEQKPGEGESKAASISAAPVDTHRSIFYRVQYTLEELENGKVVNTRKYSLTTEEDGPHDGRVKTTSRTPISRGTAPNEHQEWMEVHVDIKCWVGAHNGKVQMTTMFDLTSVDESATKERIHRDLYSGTDTLVVLGKPVVIATVDDPTFSDHAYQISATVTRMNP